MKEQPVSVEETTQELPQTPPTTIQRWHCDTYCRNVRHVHCPGETGKDSDAPDPCPFFEEMLY